KYSVVAGQSWYPWAIIRRSRATINVAKERSPAEHAGAFARKARVHEQHADPTELIRGRIQGPRRAFRSPQGFAAALPEAEPVSAAGGRFGTAEESAAGQPMAGSRWVPDAVANLGSGDWELRGRN